MSSNFGTCSALRRFEPVTVCEIQSGTSQTKGRLGNRCAYYGRNRFSESRITDFIKYFEITHRAPQFLHAQLTSSSERDRHWLVGCICGKIVSAVGNREAAHHLDEVLKQ